MSAFHRALLFPLALAALLAAPGPARAGGPDAGDAEKVAAGAAAQTKKAFELFKKRDYKAARAEFEKALDAGLDEDTVHGYLARIAYFYAEDDEARTHLAKIGTKSRYDTLLEAILDTPFRADYKDAVAIMQGFSDKRHYYVATDLGFDQAKWDQVKGEYAQLKAAAEKGNKKAQKLLFDLLQKNRTAGVVECAKALDDIYEQYSNIIRFEKDAKLVARVIICKERADYLSFGEKIAGHDVSDTGGFYLPWARILLVSAQDVGKQYGVLWESTRHTIFHEAFHQFIDYWIEDCPSWLNEGLAEFFSTADDDPKTKRLILGAVQKKPSGSMGMTSYQEIMGAFKPTAVFPPYPIKDFIRISQDEYYARAEANDQRHRARMSANYAQGWALCHFLVMGHKGGRKIIYEYLKALKEGKSNEEAIGIAFKDFKSDADWEKLEKEWRRYMASL